MVPPQASNGRLAPPAARWCLAAVAALSTYLASDLLLGALLIRPLSPQLQSDPVVHHTPTPDTYSRIRTVDFDSVHRSNNLGLRGRDLSPQKPPGTYRVVMLGDSFTAGKGVADDETFSHLLEETLDRGEGPRVEVLNAGVDSYAPLASYVQLREKLLPLEPDLVVLNFDMSDLLQETSYRLLARYSADGEILALPGKPEEQAEEGRGPGLLRRWIDRRHYVTRWVLARLEPPPEWSPPTLDATVRRKNKKILVHTLDWDTHNRDKEFAQVFDSIRRIRDLCADHGIDFLLTTYPWGHQVHEREWREGRKAFVPEGAKPSDRSILRLRDFAAAERIDFVDTLPDFRAYRGERPLYFDNDMHWTPQGHRVMADALETHLRRYLERPRRR